MRPVVQHHRAVSVGLLVVCALAGCASPELKQANRFAGEGKWDQAVAAYQEAQRKAPFDETIQRQLDQAKTAAAADHYALGKLAFGKGKGRKGKGSTTVFDVKSRIAQLNSLLANPEYSESKLEHT